MKTKISTKVIVVEQSNSLFNNLLRSRCQVFRAKDSEEVLSLGRNQEPTVIIVDLDSPSVNLLDLYQEIRKDQYLSRIPIIMITDPLNSEEKMYHSSGKIVDSSLKKGGFTDLLERIQNVVQQNQVALDVDPVTNLPERLGVIQELKRRLDKKIPSEIAFIDLDHFNVYNEYFGYSRGDQVIKYISKVLSKILYKRVHNMNWYLGHLGADEFVLIADLDIVQDVCDQFIHEFDLGIKDLYDESDLKRGFIINLDRCGRERKYPIMTVSIGIASTENGNLKHYGKIFQIGKELKYYAKNFKENKIIWDNRVYL